MAESLESARKVVGGRICERREAAGLTQAELARRAYVSRQTVNNWEVGRTLIDVQSLGIVARELGTSASELLGERGVDAVRAEAGARHEVVVLLGKAALVYAMAVISMMVQLCVISLSAGGDESYEALRALVSFVRLALLVWSGVLCARVERFMRAHDLPDATRLWAFLEGRDPDDELPDDFLYRYVLPMWRFWLFLALMALFLLAMLPALLV